MKAYFKGTRTIVYDTKLRRPGCVLLQAAYRATIPHVVLDMEFGAKCWLVAPTPDMHLFEVTHSQLEQLVKITHDFNKGKVL